MLANVLILAGLIVIAALLCVKIEFKKTGKKELIINGKKIF